MSDVDSADAARLDATFRPDSLLANRYRLVKKAGVGGMGTVWLAHDQALDAPCAVKLVNDEFASNEQVRARFTREAKLSAQLRSPHVVHVFDCGESNGTLFIVMEWLEGESLAMRLAREGRLDALTTHRVVAHVARALMSAHALGIVHRDLKPDNVYLVPGYDEEIAKVLDFGIAHDSVYSLKDRATREGTLLGTPWYMSPEQARGRHIDHRADLWSLGVIVFECLTGHSPFDAQAIGEVMGRILYEAIPLPSEFNPSLPPAFDAWWTQAVSRDREGRFQSAKELADELAKALGLESSVTVPLPERTRISSFPDTRASGISLRPSPTNGASRLPLRPDEHATLVGDGFTAPAVEPSQDQADGEPPEHSAKPSEAAEPDLADSDAEDSSDTLVALGVRRFPRWLAVGVPVLLVLAGLAGFLLQRSRGTRASFPAAQPALPDAPLPTPSTNPEVEPAEPVIRLENLPEEPLDATKRPAKKVPSTTRRAVPAKGVEAPAPAPSTRDYGI